MRTMMPKNFERIGMATYSACTPPPISYSAWLIYPRLWVFTASVRASKTLRRSRAVSWRYRRPWPPRASCRPCPVAASCGKHFVLDVVQPYDGRSAVFAEMTTNGVAYFVAQRFHGIGLGEDGLAKGTSDETTFIGLFDEEYDFLHGVSPAVGRSIASVRRSRGAGFRVPPAMKPQAAPE